MRTAVVLPAPLGPRRPSTVPSYYREIQAVQRPGLAVALLQPFGQNGGSAVHHMVPFRGWRSSLIKQDEAACTHGNLGIGKNFGHGYACSAAQLCHGAGAITGPRTIEIREGILQQRGCPGRSPTPRACFAPTPGSLPHPFC